MEESFVKSEEQMMAEIKKKRKLMIETAIEKGFTNRETVRYSQELDRLLLEYQYKQKTKKQNLEIQFYQKSILFSLYYM